MLSVRISLALFSILFLLSCVGPVKEIKYQFEDSMDDPISYIDNPQSLKEISNNFNLEISWSLNLGDSGKRNFKSPIDDNNIYFVSHIGIISSHNINSQELLWSYQHSNKILSGLSLSATNIFFVDSKGYLCSLSKTGKLEWKAYVGEVLSPPLVLSSSVIVNLISSKFVSLNIIDGSINWSYNSPSGPLKILSWEEMIENEGKIYSGIAGGKIIAINAENGSLIWETTFSPPKGSSEIERSNDTTSNLIIDEFFVYGISSNGNIAALNINNGEIIWSRPLSSFYGMTSNDNYLFVTHNSGSVYSLSKETNKVKWRNSDFLGRDLSKGYLFDGYIIVSDFEGYLHFLNIDNGFEEARIKIGDTYHTMISKIKDDEMIVVSLDGTLYKIIVQLKNKLSVNKAVELEDKNGLISDNDSNSDIKKKNNQEDSLFDNLIFWD